MPQVVKLAVFYVTCRTRTVHSAFVCRALVSGLMTPYMVSVGHANQPSESCIGQGSKAPVSYAFRRFSEAGCGCDAGM
jgi:hypothetical protein